MHTIKYQGPEYFSLQLLQIFISIFPKRKHPTQLQFFLYLVRGPDYKCSFFPTFDTHHLKFNYCMAFFEFYF